MKTERANLAQPVLVALVEMGAGRVVEKELERHGNQRFKELTLKQFCQLEKINLYSTCGISFTYAGWIEELLKLYSLQFCMPAALLDLYESLYNSENAIDDTMPIETEEDILDAAKILCTQSSLAFEETSSEAASSQSEPVSPEIPKEKPIFNEKAYKENLERELHRSPVCRSRLTDIGWNMYTTAKEAYMNQPWYMKLFFTHGQRAVRAAMDVIAVHEAFATTSEILSSDAEKYFFEHREEIQNPF